jgi:hypothetical protein
VDSQVKALPKICPALFEAAKRTSSWQGLKKADGLGSAFEKLI